MFTPSAVESPRECGHFHASFMVACPAIIPAQKFRVVGIRLVVRGPVVLRRSPDPAEHLLRVSRPLFIRFNPDSGPENQTIPASLQVPYDYGDLVPHSDFRRS